MESVGRCCGGGEGKSMVADFFFEDKESVRWGSVRNSALPPKFLWEERMRVSILSSMERLSSSSGIILYEPKWWRTEPRDVVVSQPCSKKDVGESFPGVNKII